MLFHKTSDFPREYVDEIAGDMPARSKNDLKELSVETILITHDGHLLGVFGIIPHGMLSDYATVWAIFPDTSVSTLAILRKGRELFNKWVAEVPYKLTAECWAVNDTAQKFARFMGFTPIDGNDRIITMLHEGAA